MPRSESPFPHQVEVEFRRLSENLPSETHPLYWQIVAARQALAWVLAPTGVTSPADMLLGSAAEIEDYRSQSRPRPFADGKGSEGRPA